MPLDPTLLRLPKSFKNAPLTEPDCLTDYGLIVSNHEDTER